MDTRKDARGRLLGSLTFRLVLLVAASAVGLWLGAGSRSAAAGRPAVQPTDQGKSLIADAFRFDILLARAEPEARPAVPVERPAAPAVTVVACSEPVQTVEAPVRVALDLRGPARPHTHHLTGPRVRPAGGWQIRVDGRAARLGQTEKQIRETLEGLPGLMTAEREMLQQRLQCELQRASTAAQTLTLDERGPRPEADGAAEVRVESTVDTAPPGCDY